MITEESTQSELIIIVKNITKTPIREVQDCDVVAATLFSETRRSGGSAQREKDVSCGCSDLSLVDAMKRQLAGSF